MEKLKRVVVKEELVALTGDYIAAIILNQFLYWSERTKDYDKFITEENKRVQKFLEDSEQKETEKTDGWIYKTANELINECMLFSRTKVRSAKKKDEKIANEDKITENKYQSKPIKEATCLTYIQYLIDQGWIDKRRNPLHGYDRTYQYRINLINIFNDLLEIGYILQDYKLPVDFISKIQKLKLQTKIKVDNAPIVGPESTSKIEDGTSKIEDGTSKVEDGTSKVENTTSKVENATSKVEEQYQRLLTETTIETTLESTEDKESQFKSKPSSIYINKILDILKTTMSDVSFKTWIEPSFKSSYINNKEIIIPCLNAFSKSILETRYADAIETAVSSIASLNGFKLTLNTSE